jgi:hypothetical protein
MVVANKQGLAVSYFVGGDVCHSTLYDKLCQLLPFLQGAIDHDR